MILVWCESRLRTVMGMPTSGSSRDASLPRRNAKQTSSREALVRESLSILPLGSHAFMASFMVIIGAAALLYCNSAAVECVATRG